MTTDRLWDAVASITEATSRKIDRGSDADWLDALRSDPDLTVCDVQAYRAATLAYGRIPSLWEQATWALMTGSEPAEGGGRTPLRERSPADLDLMETMSTIRETVLLQLQGRNVKPRGTSPAQMRQLASELARHPEHTASDGVNTVEWWAYRFEQWARMLQTHLRDIDMSPRPVYLRGAPCPDCRTRTVTILEDREPRIVPALKVDFVNGWIRAAQCQACGSAWFRGNQLGELADRLELSEADSRLAG